MVKITKIYEEIGANCLFFHSFNQIDEDIPQSYDIFTAENK
jgi:hypothetical protein